MIEIKDGKVYIEGKETTDPTYIGFAVLDWAEEHKSINIHTLCTH